MKTYAMLLLSLGIQFFILTRNSKAEDTSMYDYFQDLTMMSYKSIRCPGAIEEEKFSSYTHVTCTAAVKKDGTKKNATHWQGDWTDPSPDSAEGPKCTSIRMALKQNIPAAIEETQKLVSKSNP